MFFLPFILLSCFSTLLLINSALFISGLTEFGILDLMDLPKKRSFAEPVPSLEAVEFIAKVISSRCVL